MQLSVSGNTITITDISGAESDAINAAMAANQTGDHFDVSVSLEALPLGTPGPNPVTALALSWDDPADAAGQVTPPSPPPTE